MTAQQAQEEQSKKKTGADHGALDKDSKVSWESINKPIGERPVLQVYHGIEELPPIPISIPQKGAIGETGDWRTYMPVIDQELCIKCGNCYMYCPDASISWNEQEQIYVIDYVYCKGCGICADECPKDCIEMKLEDK